MRLVVLHTLIFLIYLSYTSCNVSVIRLRIPYAEWLMKRRAAIKQKPKSLIPFPRVGRSYIASKTLNGGGYWGFPEGSRHLIPFPRVGKRQSLIPFPRVGRSFTSPLREFDEDASLEDPIKISYSADGEKQQKEAFEDDDDFKNSVLTVSDPEISPRQLHHTGRMMIIPPWLINQEES